MTGLQKVTSASATWRAMPKPIDGLDIKIYWSEARQIFEVLFRNRYRDTIHFGYGASSVRPAVTNARRSLGASDETSPPGWTISGAVPGGQGCVRVNKVFIGPQDNSNYL